MMKFGAWSLGLLALAAAASAQPALTPEGATPARPAAAAVSASTAGPWQVMGVVVELPESAGFNRDTALAEAARQALPTVLTQDADLPPAQAASRAAAVGDAFQFVSRYTVVEEKVVPQYRLVVDLTFDEAALRRNFGGRVEASAAPAATGPVATAEQVPAGRTAAGLPAAPQWVVSLPKMPAAELEQLRQRLNGLPETQATYGRIGADDVELNLQTTQAEPALRLAMGPNLRARLTPYEAPVVPLQGYAAPGMESWGEAPGQPPRRERPSWFPSFW